MGFRPSVGSCRFLSALVTSSRFLSVIRETVEVYWIPVANAHRYNLRPVRQPVDFYFHFRIQVKKKKKKNTLKIAFVIVKIMAN